MELQLLHILQYFGLGAASGLNSTLPLLFIGLFARAGKLTLVPPFDVLGRSDFLLWGLLALAVLEFLADKSEHFDSLLHKVQMPFAVAAGAILAGSQSGAVNGVEPDLTVIIGLLTGGTTAGFVHSLRATLRPAVKVPLMGGAISLVEDVTALSLTTASVLAPPLIPVILIGLGVLIFLLIKVFWDVVRAIWRYLVGGGSEGGWTGGEGGDIQGDQELKVPTRKGVVRRFLEWLQRVVGVRRSSRPVGSPRSSSADSGPYRWLHDDD